MDTTFLSWLLLFSLVLILGLYLQQSMGKSGSGKANTTKTEKFLPIIWDTCPRRVNADGMPVHRVGPVYNFHQHFNKYNPALGAGSPTGIPEMGWRNYYLSRYKSDGVEWTDPFSGTPIRTFLDNMENVENIYREC
jgi:hypothetical protein